MAKILVIDDDAHLLKMLGLMLERAGHQTILADHGQQGIEMALHERPDMAIVDVMMPDMSGHEVCKQLRARQATVELPILILTARSQPVDREAALQSGANDFMSKPVSPKELADKVDQLINVSGAGQDGRIITIFSLRGGVGVTTLCTNLAGALRKLQVPNITLVDLSPNSGHVTLQLRMHPQRNWSRLLNQNDVSPDTVRPLLIGHPSGLNVLGAPLAPTHDASLTEKQTTQMAKILADRAEFVIMDAPPTLSPMCTGALKAAHLIILVMTADVASVQTVSGTLRALVDMGISGKKVHLMLNHTSDQQGLPKAAVERALKRPISFVIPFDPNQFRALAQGSPLSLDPSQSTPLTETMTKIAGALKKAA